MTSYYVTQMRAFEEIDKRLTAGLEASGSVNIDHLILEMSRLYPISPKAIEKRIYLYVSANSDHLEIKKNEVRII